MSEYIPIVREMLKVHKIAFKHWMIDKPYYWSWNQMIQRCTNPKNSNYSNYWWRWITVCDKRRTFQWFYEDMWDTWKEWLTIDRIDVNDNYYKENCKRSTKKEQWNNKRNNIIIEFNWQKNILAERWRIIWIKPTTIRKRMKLWRPIEKCLTIKNNNVRKA